MNLPNTLTVARLFLAPVFFILYFLPDWIGGGAVVSTWLLLAVYAVIEATDLLDGYFARKLDLVTDIGKVMDPFADVFSRITYFVCFTVAGLMPPWVFLIILYRELGVTFLRMLMIRKGVVMAASVFGKIKAVIYAVSSILGILYTAALRFSVVEDWMSLLYIVMISTFIFGAAAALLSLGAYMKAVLKG